MSVDLSKIMCPNILLQFYLSFLKFSGDRRRKRGVEGEGRGARPPNNLKGGSTYPFPPPPAIIDPPFPSISM